MSDQQENTTDRPRGVEALKNHLVEHKVETALWVSRILTIIFSVAYLLPLFG
jgi:hypothetical protein